MKTKVGPIIEIVNMPRKGMLIEKTMMKRLVRLASDNKAKRLLLVFER